MGTITEYFEQFKEGDTTLPSAQALTSISRVLDYATQHAIADLMQVLRVSNEHQARVALLQHLPRTSGKFSQNKVIFRNVSSFEQMVAISDWLALIQIRKNHTFFLSVCDDTDYVPTQVKKYAGIDANLMHVRLGATTGARKAPKYSDWAQSDPWGNNTQKVFIYALEGLEIARQPQFSAATVMKGNAFENEWVGSDWRYGSTYACVEDKGQSAAGQAKITSKKEKSAGLNAAALVHSLADDSDPQAEESNICLSLNYEDYSDNGYLDDLNIEVSPGAIIKSAEAAIVQQDMTELTRLMENLVIAKIKVPRTPTLCNYIAQKLIANHTNT